MERNWEYFEQGPVEFNTERIHVTLNSRGNFFLNRRAFEALGEPDQVVLMFDRRRSTIGITRALSSQLSAFRLKRKDLKRKGGRVLYASNFCRFHQISLETTHAFSAAEVDKDGVLILDLHEVRSVRKV